ncbi:BON domain-containing protein [Burkholderia sp. CF099]|nr:BON domain-containing protein [Burkholderia sp. CF099]
MKVIQAVVCSVVLCSVMSPTVSVLAQPSSSGAEASAPTTAASDAKAAKTANKALRKAVIRQLSRTPGLDVGGINVVAKTGVVTLLGVVPDTRQIELAGQIAQEVRGVTEVRNTLTLQTNGR